MVLMGAAYGALWEAGLMNGLWSRLLRGHDRRAWPVQARSAAFILGRGPAARPAASPWRSAGLAAFLVLVRLVSMAWAVLRLHDFRLTRIGDDLRVTYGFFTRVAATIPLRRVQTVTVRRGWLARRLGRASIRVETAGGRAGAATRDREWMAPLVRERDVGALLGGSASRRDPAGGRLAAGASRARSGARVKPVLLLASIASTVAGAHRSAGGS